MAAGDIEGAVVASLVGLAGRLVVGFGRSGGVVGGSLGSCRERGSRVGGGIGSVVAGIVVGGRDIVSLGRGWGCRTLWLCDEVPSVRFR